MNRALARQRLNAASHHRLGAIIALLTFCLAFITYLETLCPTVYVGDSGELASVAWLMDIAHPTGYPLFSMLAKAFALAFPFGSAVLRINVFSAVCAAWAILFLFVALHRLFGSAAIAAAASLALAFSQTFWSQSVISEVYALHMMLLCAIIAVAVKAATEPDRRYLYLLWFLTGLAIANHMSTVLALPLLLALSCWQLIKNRFSWRGVAASLILFLLGCSTYIYLPVRATAPHLPGNWGDPSTLERFLFHIMGRQFSGLMFSQSARQVLINFGQYIQRTGREFAILGGLAGLIGLALWSFRRRVMLGLWLLFWFPFVFYAINYNVADVEVFFLPCHLALAFAICAGARFVLRWTQPRLRPVTILLLGLISIPALLNFHACFRATHRLGYLFARLIADTPGRHATVFTFGWSSPFVLRYVTAIEALRPGMDVRINWTVRNVAERRLGLSKSETVYYEFPSHLDDAPSRVLLPDGVLFHIQRRSAQSAPNTPPAVVEAWLSQMEDKSLWLDWLDRAVLAKVHYMLGAGYARWHDETNARRHLRAAERLGFDNAGILNNIGSVWFNEGRFAEALRLFAEASKADPGLVIALMNIASCYLKMGRYDMAISVYKSLPTDFGYPYIHVVAGDAYLKTGRYDAAIAEYLKALKEEPKLACAFNNLGTAYDALGQADKAIAAYKRAIEIDGDFASPYNNLATIALRQGRLLRAQALAMKAISLDPSLAEAYSTLGNVESILGRYETAEMLYTTAVQKGAYSAAVLNNLAVASLKLGRIQRARLLLEAALLLDPDFEKAAENLAVIEAILTQK